MRGCSRLTLVLSRRAVTGAAWAEVARTVARVALARVVERVAVGERAVGRAVVATAVVARAAAAELEAVGAFARAPPDGPRAPAAGLSRLSSLRSQVQLGLYIVRGDNMCAPAPRCRRHRAHRYRPHRAHSNPARVRRHRHQAHGHPRLGPVTRHAASPPLHSSPESTEPSLRVCHPNLPPSPRARVPVRWWARSTRRRTATWTGRRSSPSRSSRSCTDRPCSESGACCRTPPRLSHRHRHLLQHTRRNGQCLAHTRRRPCDSVYVRAVPAL